MSSISLYEKNSELTTRYRYTIPVPVSTTTALHYRQFKKSTSVASTLGSIPETSDLLKMKADVESLLPLSERRIRHLQRDLSFIRKNVKMKESNEDEQEQLDKQNQSSKKVGKSKLPATLDKMLVKKETIDESSNTLHSHNKGQMERQLALEVLRRKRRRDEDSNGGIQKTKNMPPYAVTKAKKTEDTAAATTSTKIHSKTGQNSHTKKKKSVVEQNSLKQRSTAATHQEIDFVRVKPKDQIPILTFWSSLDPHFRPLAEEDRQFLLASEEDEQFYKIPPLGRHYADVWSENESVSTLINPTRLGNRSALKHKYLGLDQSFVKEHLFCENISCGQLTERLLSSLVTEPCHDEEITDLEDEINDYDEHESDLTMEKNYKNSQLYATPSEDVVKFEENLKRELRYVGLFGEDDVDWDSKEDDEICVELRSTIKELKEQFAVNEFRKKDY
ncbi:uncharacterized protein BX663DRAFT_464577 [Cokeromyces recurvatus]|uniref:uncharacterized protein n=1 Tax=Cokeromyces recurvatus TaxID=90255 RepID=UPI00221E9EAB|nr:uncharacterized protein BX663DRAFT_464577 [Cokeromyces recurvatus]KAI7908062.1 hypothetical protein BX663DRAFT_464577 [Cokeromyces recurvatus]